MLTVWGKGILLLLLLISVFPVFLSMLLFTKQGALMCDVIRNEQRIGAEDQHDLALYIANVENGDWTETAGPILSPSHWNYYIRTFISDELSVYANNYAAVELEMEQRSLGEDIDAVFTDYAVGTVLVKAHYKQADDQKPEKITFMIKEAYGYDPRQNNWRYVEADNGVVRMNGNSRDLAVYQRCIQCHESVRTRHHLYNNYLHEKHHDLITVDE